MIYNWLNLYLDTLGSIEVRALQEKIEGGKFECLEMQSKQTMLLCLQNKKEEDEDTNDHKRNVRRGSGEFVCPPGYWCKRNMFRENDVVTSYLLECPSNTFCKRKANNDFSTSKRGSCPPGYWCKRNIEATNMADNADTCPPGYWCRRQSQFSDALKSFGDECKSWCVKEIIGDRFVTREATRKPSCPAAHWCKRSGKVLHVVKDEMFSRHCPPGYWCKRKEWWRHEILRIIRNIIKRVFTIVKNIRRRAKS